MHFYIVLWYTYSTFLNDSEHDSEISDTVLTILQLLNYLCSNSLLFIVKYKEIKMNTAAKKTDLDYIAQLRLMDDDFMSKCFEDNIECTELVIRVILGRDDIIVKSVHTQHQIKNLQGKSVILDIFAVDDNGQ